MPTKKISKKQKKPIKKQLPTDDNLDIPITPENLPSDPEILPISNRKNTHKPVWTDKTDANLEIDISNTARFRKLRKNDGESKITGDEYQKRLENFYNNKLNDLDFFKWSTNISEKINEETINSSKTKLADILNQDFDILEKWEQNEMIPNKIINLIKLGGLKKKDQHNAVIQSIDFHKNSELFLSAGFDKMIKLYSVRKENENEEGDHFQKNLKVLKKIYLQGMPITQSKFLNEKNEIISCGLKKHLLCYDLLTEKIEKISSVLFTEKIDKKIDGFAISPQEDYLSLYNDKGNIFVFSAKNKQFLFELKQNDACNSLVFSNDSNFLFSTGNDGRIYQWDLNKRTIFNCFKDLGASKTTCLDLSEDQGFLASGGPMGIVNIYEKKRNEIVFNEKPIKEIKNLTTTISDLCFNKRNELLAISSKWKKNAIRLVHVPSLTVFSNWPNLQTKLQFVTKTKFSHNSKYLAIGNDEGNVFLYNIRHYN